MILGTISAVDSSNGLQLTIDGEDSPTTKKYTYMASYVPAANDRVLIEEISGSYVIMGKVINDVDSSGIARQAATATTADTAATATNATTADSATISDKTKGFDSSVKSENGQLVTNVYRRYSSEIGDYYISDITLGISHSFVYK